MKNCFLSTECPPKKPVGRAGYFVFHFHFSIDEDIIGHMRGGGGGDFFQKSSSRPFSG